MRGDCVSGANYPIIDVFSRNLSRCPRGHTFVRDGHDYVVFCFAVEADTEAFRERFNGEIVDPKKRPRWPGSKR